MKTTKKEINHENTQTRRDFSSRFEALLHQHQTFKAAMGSELRSNHVESCKELILYTHSELAASPEVTFHCEISSNT